MDGFLNYLCVLLQKAMGKTQGIIVNGQNR